jgi:hypothetical protein
MSQGSAISLTRASTGSWRIASKKPRPSNPFPVARQRRRQVEAEAVDMHLLDPVAQAVHHHAQHHRMATFSVLPVPVSLM